VDEPVFNHLEVIFLDVVPNEKMAVKIGLNYRELLNGKAIIFAGNYLSCLLSTVNC
jgi:hypothetical protein